MNLNPKWVPMKWPCGPLEIARRKKSEGEEVGAKSTLEAWAHPAALQLLKGTPVNCLIVDWASGDPQDLAQQLALKPILQAGRQLGISFVGRVSAKENFESAVAAGRAAAFSPLLMVSMIYASSGLWPIPSEKFSAPSLGLAGHSAIPQE